MTTSPASATERTTAPAAGSVNGLAAPARRRRPVLVLVGLFLAALAAVLVAAALNAASARTMVWSTSTPVARGQPVQASDLVAVEVAEDTAGSLVAATFPSRERLDGQVWAADLPAGHLVSPALTVQRLAVADGQALVGLRLDPGGFPSAGLRPGDSVSVVAAGEQQGAAAQVLVERGVVESVAVLSDQGPASPRLVTVSVPEGQAGPVAAAGTSGRVSLVVVP